MRPRLIIMQGKPASGKSFIAEAIRYWAGGAKLPVIVSVDGWLYLDGKYVFTYDRHTEAHQECFTRALELMKQAHPIIILDNPNLKYRDVKQYIISCYKYGYDYQIVRVQVPYHMQVNQNDTRRPDRRIPLEKFKYIHPEDLLAEHPETSLIKLIWSIIKTRFKDRRARRLARMGK